MSKTYNANGTIERGMKIFNALNGVSRTIPEILTETSLKESITRYFVRFFVKNSVVAQDEGKKDERKFTLAAGINETLFRDACMELYFSSGKRQKKGMDRDAYERIQTSRIDDDSTAEVVRKAAAKRSKVTEAPTAQPEDVSTPTEG